MPYLRQRAGAVACNDGHAHKNSPGALTLPRLLPANVHCMAALCVHPSPLLLHHPIGHASRGQCTIREAVLWCAGRVGKGGLAMHAPNGLGGRVCATIVNQAALWWHPLASPPRLVSRLPSLAVALVVLCLRANLNSGVAQVVPESVAAPRLGRWGVHPAPAAHGAAPAFVALLKLPNILFAQCQTSLLLLLVIAAHCISECTHPTIMTEEGSEAEKPRTREAGETAAALDKVTDFREEKEMMTNVDKELVQQAMQKLAAEQAQRTEAQRQRERELAAVKVGRRMRAQLCASDAVALSTHIPLESELFSQCDNHFRAACWKACPWPRRSRRRTLRSLRSSLTWTRRRPSVR